MTTSLLAFGMPGMPEWIIILVIALLLFGRRLPEVMRGLGGGVREFRKGVEGVRDPLKDEDKTIEADATAKEDGASTTEEAKAPSEPRS